jgi:IS5 family transposase
MCLGMTTHQLSFFDESDRLAKLTKLRDPLVDLERSINFEMFRQQLETAVSKPKVSPTGRKRYDVVRMFKILILQRRYNLSDEQIEYQINDRCSFQRFLGLHLGSTVPDFTTVWGVREALRKAGAIRALFEVVNSVLEAYGVITKTGTLIDASFVDMPRLRNSREENKMIKQGRVPAAWKSQPRKLSQKDVEARWTKKNQETQFGYESHVKADVDSVIITDYQVTDAAVHVSRPLGQLIAADNQGESLFADSAYKSARIDETLAQLGVQNFVHEKAARNRPLSELQLQLNRIKSQVRCRVEHIFGHMENSMGGPELEYIGLRRISVGIGLSNLTYNLHRFVQLVRLGQVPPMPQCT